MINAFNIIVFKASIQDFRCVQKLCIFTCHYIGIESNNTNFYECNLFE